MVLSIEPNQLDHVRQNIFAKYRSVCDFSYNYHYGHNQFLATILMAITHLSKNRFLSLLSWMISKLITRITPGDEQYQSTEHQYRLKMICQVMLIHFSFALITWFIIFLCIEQILLIGYTGALWAIVRPSESAHAK